MIRGTIVQTTAGVAGALLFLCLCGCDDKAQPAADSTSAPQHAVREKSVHAYLDPITGQLRDPTPEELATETSKSGQKKQPASAANTEPSVQREVVLPNGAIEVTLEPSAQHALLACIEKDGSIKMEHECAREQGAQR